MKMLRSFRALAVRLAGFFRRQSWEEELDAELTSNVEMHVEDNIRAGMSPVEARRAARLRYGSVKSGSSLFWGRGRPFLRAASWGVSSPVDIA